MAEKTVKSKLRRMTKEDIILDTTNTIIMIILMAVTLYPFINTIAISLNDAIDSVRGGIYLWPRVFTLVNYRIILSKDTVYNATIISVLRSMVGTAIGINASFVVGYALSRHEFVLNKLYSRIFVYSMYFSAGLIPSYFLIRDLHLRNNFLVYIIPGIVNAWNIMVVRSFIEGLPGSLIESAKVDGAKELRIMYSIIFPLCLPVTATIALFVAVGQWNSWFDTMLYCSSTQSLSTLQFELQKVLQSTQELSTRANITQNGAANRNAVTPNSLKATMTIISVVPIMFVYPFLQKYFVKGLTLGGVKG